MIDEVFVDGVGEIGFASGAVRINLVSLATTERDGEGKPRREVRQRLVLTPQGFVEVYGAMHNLMAKMVESGLIQRNLADKAAGDKPAGDGETALTTDDDEAPPTTA